MDITQILLQIAIGLLGAALPWLGSLLGGPLGWIAGLAIKWVSGWLIGLAERLARYSKIDRQIKTEVDAAVASTQALLNATPETKEKALEDFKAAHRKLGHLDLVR